MSKPSSCINVIPAVRNYSVMQEGKIKALEQSENADDLDDALEGDGDNVQQPLTTTFELNDTLYAEAQLEETDSVYLWLGVSVFRPGRLEP